MSDAYFATRLRFHDGRGLAKLHGKSLVLLDAPLICGVLVVELDYAPETGTAELRPTRSEKRREMYRDEIAACDELLLRLAPLMK